MMLIMEIEGTMILRRIMTRIRKRVIIWEEILGVKIEIIKVRALMILITRRNQRFLLRRNQKLLLIVNK